MSSDLTNSNEVWDIVRALLCCLVAYVIVLVCTHISSHSQLTERTNQTTHCLLYRGASAYLTARAIVLKKERVEEYRGANQCSLLAHCRFGWKFNQKGIGFGQELRKEALGDLDNLAEMRGVTPVGLPLIRRKDPKRYLAASTSSTRIALGAAIHTHTGTAGWRMDRVDGLPLTIVQRKGRHTIVALLSDGPHSFSTTRHSDMLKAATLARRNRTGARTFDRQDLGIRIELRHFHRVRIASGATNSAQTRRFLE